MSTKNLLPKDKNGCPFLLLAPMEGVGDRSFRRAMASIGGFDEAVREFLRVPRNAHIPSLAAPYDANELAPIPLVAQIMGAELDLMAEMASYLAQMGAPRIDVNCGCPSNTVTGKGAGSSLLKEPDFLHQVVSAVVKVVNVPVSVKMRSGYQDTSLFKENLLAVQESGVSFVTLHPRTKVDGYGPPAKWELIAEAKSILSIPLVGNGDILNVADAVNMLNQTKCDGLMIGRGSVVNPFIFRQIKAYYAQEEFKIDWHEFENYFALFTRENPLKVPEKTKVNKLKQLMSYLFRGNEELQAMRLSVLTGQYEDCDALLKFAFPLLKKGFKPSLPPKS